jgi:tetratricopeptide (TPR) repeat protein
MSARLETIRSLLSQDPNNSFLRYGAAMELANLGRLDEAIAEYRALIAADANYSAAYYHGGRALESAGKIDEARAMYQDGIAATRRNGDAHTLGELQAALDLLG